MTRSKIIILILVIIATIFGILLLQQLSKRTIDIILSGDDFSVILYNGDTADELEIAELSNSMALSLHDGYYCAVVVGEKYSAAEQCFVVYKKNKTIEITPEYSVEYLASLLTEPEKQLIEQTLQTTYPQTITGFTPAAGALVDNGMWYVGALTQKTESRSEQGDTYRFILHKVGDAWQFAAKPQLVISSPDFPDIPKTVVEAANNL